MIGKAILFTTLVATFMLFDAVKSFRVKSNRLKNTAHSARKHVINVTAGQSKPPAPNSEAISSALQKYVSGISLHAPRTMVDEMALMHTLSSHRDGPADGGVLLDPNGNGSGFSLDLGGFISRTRAWYRMLIDKIGTEAFNAASFELTPFQLSSIQSIRKLGDYWREAMEALIGSEGIRDQRVDLEDEAVFPKGSDEHKRALESKFDSLIGLRKDLRRFRQNRIEFVQPWNHNIRLWQGTLQVEGDRSGWHVDPINDNTHTDEFHSMINASWRDYDYFYYTVAFVVDETYSNFISAENMKTTSFGAFLHKDLIRGTLYEPPYSEDIGWIFCNEVFIPEVHGVHKGLNDATVRRWGMTAAPTPTDHVMLWHRVPSFSKQDADVLNTAYKQGHPAHRLIYQGKRLVRVQKSLAGSTSHDAALQATDARQKQPSNKRPALKGQFGNSQQ